MNTEVGTDQGAGAVSAGSESGVKGAELESGFDAALRESLASGVEVARAAVEEFAGGGVGEHLGVTIEAEFTTTHSFGADLTGYRGWYWACVLAKVPGGELTVDEIALLPGAEALVAPEWVPWEKRVRAGDLGVGDLLPPSDDDERLVPGHSLTGDKQLDELAAPIGLGREHHLSLEGRADAAVRWTAERGPDAEIARSAKHHCGSCGFLVPLAGGLSSLFGVCANEFSADGQVVHLQYGCGAHSAVEVPKSTATDAPEAYDDAAVDVVVLPQQLKAAAKARAEANVEAKAEAEPTPEHTTEPTNESKAEPTNEPTPEHTTESKAEPTPEHEQVAELATSESNPATAATSEAAESDAKPEPQPEAAPEPVREAAQSAENPGQDDASSDS